MANAAQQGSSYVLNESKQVDVVSWDEHARDLLHTLHNFRDQMPPPLMGIGRSMGGAKLIGLSMLHPRLFHSITVFDGWLWIDGIKPPSPNKDQAFRTVGRKDRFVSVEMARRHM